LAAPGVPAGGPADAGRGGLAAGAAPVPLTVFATDRPAPAHGGGPPPDDVDAPDRAEEGERAPADGEPAPADGGGPDPLEAGFPDPAHGGFPDPAQAGLFDLPAADWPGAASAGRPAPAHGGGPPVGWAFAPPPPRSMATDPVGVRAAPGGAPRLVVATGVVPPAGGAGCCCGPTDVCLAAGIEACPTRLEDRTGTAAGA
jgi:hypothetical protein